VSTHGDKESVLCQSDESFLPRFISFTLELSLQQVSKCVFYDNLLAYQCASMNINHTINDYIWRCYLHQLLMQEQDWLYILTMCY